jgi:hypothetical protein
VTAAPRNPADARRQKIRPRPASHISRRPARLGEEPQARLLRAPSALSAEAVHRLGLCGSGLIWAVAEQIHSRCGGRVPTERLWTRGLAALLLAHHDATDAAVLELARGLMVVYARDPGRECAEGRAIESDTDELLRRARREGC